MNAIHTSMGAAPQIPSHLRFMMAAIQDRALDLSLAGRASVQAELDIAERYAHFELITRPDHCRYDDPEVTSLRADLTPIVGIDTASPLDQAVADARGALAEMVDHLNRLIDQQVAA